MRIWASCCKEMIAVSTIFFSAIVPAENYNRQLNKVARAQIRSTIRYA
jgi:hypothetical protein